MPAILSPYQLGALTLTSRIAMAPMTRARAKELKADMLTATYYAQRASAGLIISEGIAISEQARGAVYIPGIYTADQMLAWKRVTAAVHASGGVIFAQLWHVGRAGHVSHNHGQAPVGPTDRRADAKTFGFDADGHAALLAQSQPRPLRADEMDGLVEDYARAARAAIEAGFDGVEIHGANGYLIEQFINGALNTRGDRYGGSIANRLRLPLAIVDAVAAAAGAGRTGIRVAPFGRFNDMHAFADEAETWLAFARALSTRGLAYLHLSDQESLGADKLPVDFAVEMRRAFGGTVLIAGGFGLESGQAAIDAGRCDMVAIGRPFISNPDLLERYRHGWPIAPFDPATFYGGEGAAFYTDYPTYAQSLAG